MKPKFLRSIAALWLLCGLPALSFADVEFPLVQALCYLPFGEEGPLEKNRISLTIQLNYSNVYSLDFEGIGVNDMEIPSLELALRTGVTDSLTLELHTRIFSLTGGFLDPAIEGFHNLFGLPNARRDRYERNGIHYFYHDRFHYTDGVSGAGPLVLSACRRLTRSDHQTWAARIFVGIPLFDRPGLTSDRLFWGLGLTAENKWRDLVLSYSGAVTRIYSPDWLQEESLRSILYFFRAQVSYHRALIGGVLKTSPYQTGYFSTPALQLYAGYRLSDRLELGIIEDLPPLDTTPDIGFYLKYHPF